LLPDWPQPAGIFTKGQEFHSFVFLSMIHQLYEKVGEDTITEHEYSMEDTAFSKMLGSCIVIKVGCTLFCLYDLEMQTGNIV